METEETRFCCSNEPTCSRCPSAATELPQPETAKRIQSNSSTGIGALTKALILAVTFLAGWLCSHLSNELSDVQRRALSRSEASDESESSAPYLRAADLPLEAFLDRSDYEREEDPYIVTLPYMEPRRLSSAAQDDPPVDVPQAAPLENKTGDAVNPDRTLASNASLKNELLRQRKKENINLRVLNPHVFRAELCPFLRVGDGQIKSWYALLVLYIAEWPAYAQVGNGGERFTDQLRAFSENFVAPENTTLQGRAIFQDEIDCGTPKVFKEGLDAIKGDIHNFDDLVRILKNVAKSEPDFANLLDYTQYFKLPTRAAVTGFAMILRTAFEGMVFSFCRSLFLKNTSKGNFTRNELYSNVVWLYHRNQTQYWMLLLVAKIIKQIVSARPHNGIIILKSVTTARPGNTAAGDHAEKGQILETLYGVGAYSTLQHIVAGNIQRKLEMSLSRFQNLSTERGMLSTAKSVLQPKVFVTGYYAKNSRGAHVEEGLFGMEVEGDTLDELKEELRPSSVLLQISLVDEWNFKDTKEWPDPRSSEIGVLTAYTAVQILRAELEWDPSLGSLGAFSVAYTGFTDMYSRQRSDPENHFDPDVHLLVVDEISRFSKTGAEEGCKTKIGNLIAEEPLQIKRVFDRDRISIKGTAKILPGSDVFMRGNFGLGLSLELQHEAEKLLSPGAIMIHVYIKGLGKMTSETNDLDITASEMVNRLLLRSRGYYEIPVVKTVTVTSLQTVEARTVVNCSNKVPEWVVVVSSCSIAVFFIVIIGLLMYHDKLKLPWWLNCICSSSSPWGGDAGGVSRDPTAVELPGEYDKASLPEVTTMDGSGEGTGYDEMDGRGWLPATAKWVGDKSLSVHKSTSSAEAQRRVSGGPSSRASFACMHSEVRPVGDRLFLRPENVIQMHSHHPGVSRKTTSIDDNPQ
ncbi:putative transmembrane protein [Toxoplasma gondii RUB]|uniref:Putative transmembrane protein n=1 Tax=Toxoplasma gondii RUB TaxID=935652 RepID=A0A086LPX8_TOXGO|nr:putative transmembrane protein [Toxoplasma gondii RUB]